MHGLLLELQRVVRPHCLFHFRFSRLYEQEKEVARWGESWHWEAKPKPRLKQPQTFAQ